MRLLFDQNLPPRLAADLADLFPDSLHVASVGLDCAQDSEIRSFAFDGGYVIVTKDADFGELSLVQGFPPKVVWIRRGNCSTADIELILREKISVILELEEETETGVLVLF